MTDCDIVVVGAGPGGATAAEKLAHFGFNVVVFEKSAVPGANNVCAGMFCMSCANHFSLDPSVFERVIHKEIHFFDTQAIELENEEGVVTVLRDRFDPYLAERAVGSGAELRTDTRVTDINVLGTGQAEVRFLTGGQGKEGRLRCRAVVLADGPMSLSRKFPGLGFHATQEFLSFAFSCDVEAGGNTMNHFEMYFDRALADWGYGWVFPKKDMLNFGLVCRVPEFEENKSLLKQRLRYFMEEHPRASRVLAGRGLIRKRGAMIPQKMATKICQDSLVVVGDAAGMADSVFGGGIENAMYAAEMAATVLKSALEQDRLDSGFLKQYQDAWVASRRYRMMKVAERSRDWLCRLDGLDPRISDTLKRLGALKMRMNRDGVGGPWSLMRLLFSASYRGSMTIDAETLPHSF